MRNERSTLPYKCMVLITRGNQACGNAENTEGLGDEFVEKIEAMMGMNDGIACLGSGSSSRSRPDAGRSSKEHPDAERGSREQLDAELAHRSNLMPRMAHGSFSMPGTFIRNSLMPGALKGAA